MWGIFIGYIQPLTPTDTRLRDPQGTATPEMGHVFHFF